MLVGWSLSSHGEAERNRCIWYPQSKDKPVSRKPAIINYFIFLAGSAEAEGEGRHAKSERVRRKGRILLSSLSRQDQLPVGWRRSQDCSAGSKRRKTRDLYPDPCPYAPHSLHEVRKVSTSESRTCLSTPRPHAHPVMPGLPPFMPGELGTPPFALLMLPCPPHQ